jgi:hypothetical protein
MPQQQPKADRPTRTEERPRQTRTQRRPTSRRKAFILQRIRRQDLILLTGVLALACFSVITVGFLILRYQQSRAEPARVAGGTPGPQPTHTVTYVQITGLSQYQPAEAEARAWADDAQLVSANAHWPRIVYENQIGEPGQWTYRFYSPAKERLFIVKVGPDGQIRAFEHVALVTLPPDILDATQWSIDSPAALAMWLDQSGADLVRSNPGLEVLIQLRGLSRHPNPVWMVTGSDKRTQDIQVVLVDASTGQVVPTESMR